MSTLGDFKRPNSVVEALAMMRDGPGQGGYIAGGTSLGTARMVPYDYLIDLTGLGLNTICRDGELLRVGATASIQQLAVCAEIQTPELSFLSRAARSVATRQIRNMATVGGDLVSGYLVADLPVAFLVLDAHLILEGTEQRQISLRDFFDDQVSVYRSWNGALLTEIAFPVPPPGSQGLFLKYARTENDVAILNLACVVSIQGGKFVEARVALGATVPRPMRLATVEEFLQGKPAVERTVARAAERAAEGLSILDNIRASKAYRTEMIRVLVRRTLMASLQKGGDRR